jgi:hypothetical protein
MFEIISAENGLSTEVICKRIIQNRERQMQRFNKGQKKNDKYYSV